MRTKSSRVSACSSTRMGKRPCSSGIRSEGLLTWKAPAAMNRTGSGRTGPYLVVTADPSTLGGRGVRGGDRRPLDDGEQVALNALARDVGAVGRLPAGDLVDLVEEDDARLLRPRHGVLDHPVH